MRLFFVMLLVLPTIAEAGIAARCRRTCGSAIAACITSTGQKRRVCKRQVLRECRQNGLQVCADLTPTTTTTEPKPTDTTSTTTTPSSPTTTTTRRTTTTTTIPKIIGTQWSLLSRQVSTTCPVHPITTFTGATVDV